MGLEEQYQSFSMLQERVIKVALEEINNKTDLETSYEVKRVGRSPSSLNFYMKKKQGKLGYKPDSDKIKGKLATMGISEKKTQKLLDNHDEQYLRANIRVVEEQAQKGKISNITAYLLKAFEDDYRTPETEYSKQQKLLDEEKNELQEQKAREKASLEKLEQEFQEERNMAYEQFIK